MNLFIKQKQTHRHKEQTVCHFHPNMKSIIDIYIYIPHLKNGRLKLTIFPIQG